MDESIMLIESRTHYFDCLRIAACLAVMILHIAADNWLEASVTSFEWQIFNFYDALVRFGVPVFVMISGALFLNPDKYIPVKTLYAKYIFRIAAAFVLWSFLYAARDCMKTGDIVDAASHFLAGHYHMWFLYMIIGLYMIVPFVRQIAESESLTKYFLVLALIFASILPEAADIISVFSEKWADLLRNIIRYELYVYFAAGYTGYFLLGYVLDRADISPKLEVMIYLGGIIGAGMTILMSSYASLLKNEPQGLFYKELSVNVLLESIAVFAFFKQHCNRENKIVLKLSQYSFGAYLVHALILALLREYTGLHTLTFSPVISVPVIAVIVFIISFIISAVLNHIPVLKKYIV
ncbi:MAG: acyltransferase family protein [Synergistaceae bacterium]|nr:acyltransferase family protein [Synergistaceae bacterium]